MSYTVNDYPQIADSAAHARESLYFPPRFDALIGLIFDLASTMFCTWVARLQDPFFHLREGSGLTVQ